MPRFEEPNRLEYSMPGTPDWLLVVHGGGDRVGAQAVPDEQDHPVCGGGRGGVAGGGGGVAG
jgi:hypothetical protein